MAFRLHSRLAADTTPVTELELCRVLLMEDSRFPWLILVPGLDDLTELHHLPAARQPQLWGEIDHTCRSLQEVMQAHKLNVAALGNLVPQLHIHVVAHFRDDAAWPAPVWGNGAAVAYDDSRRQSLLRQLRQALNPAAE